MEGVLLVFGGLSKTAVVALSRITFGVFVGKNPSHRFEYRFGDEILGGDEFQTGGLTPGFVTEEVCDLPIDAVEWAIHAVVAVCGLTHSDSSIARSICRQGVGSEAILSDGVEESQLRFGETTPPRRFSRLGLFLTAQVRESHSSILDYR